MFWVSSKQQECFLQPGKFSVTKWFPDTGGVHLRAQPYMDSANHCAMRIYRAKAFGNLSRISMTTWGGRTEATLITWQKSTLLFYFLRCVSHLIGWAWERACESVCACALELSSPFLLGVQAISPPCLFRVMDANGWEYFILRWVWMQRSWIFSALRTLWSSHCRYKYFTNKRNGINGDWFFSPEMTFYYHVLLLFF